MQRGIVFTDEAKGQLSKLHVFVQRTIKQHLKKVALAKSPGKELVDELVGLRSDRIGKYRVVFELTDVQFLVLLVGHRRNIYDMARLLERSPGKNPTALERDVGRDSMKSNPKKWRIKKGTSRVLTKTRK